MPFISGERRVILPFIMIAVSEEQRLVIEKTGTPAILWDQENATRYILLVLTVVPVEGGFRAEARGIPAFGEGETEDEAVMALETVVRAMFPLPDSF